jgi:protein TonB
MIDRRGPRTIIALVVGTGLWSAVMTGFVRQLSLPDSPVPPPPALDVQIVQIAAPVPAPPVVVVTPKAAAAAIRPAIRAAAPPSEHVAAHSQGVPPQVAARALTTPPRNDPQSAAQPVASASLPPPATAAAHADGADASAKHDVSTGPVVGTGTAGATGPTEGPARIIARPLPELSDDLREEAFRAVAIARFSIHADGSVSVQLRKPTQNPRLNSLLIDSLKQWRFSPATKNGQPIDSEQDIRVHFDVE